MSHWNSQRWFPDNGLWLSYIRLGQPGGFSKHSEGLHPLSFSPADPEVQLLVTALTPGPAPCSQQPLAQAAISICICPSLCWRLLGPCSLAYHLWLSSCFSARARLPQVWDHNTCRCGALLPPDRTWRGCDKESPAACYNPRESPGQLAGDGKASQVFRGCRQIAGTALIPAGATDHGPLRRPPGNDLPPMESWALESSRSLP